MQKTAPNGYQSNHHAIIELIRFGYAIWNPHEMAVLLFHAERSTLYGREADQHSYAQAIEGVWSRRTNRWIRGPAGVSRSTWKRVNSQLEAAGYIQAFRCTHASGADAAKEYAIDWLAVKAAIETFQTTCPNQAQHPAQETLDLEPPTATNQTPSTPFPVVQREPRGGSQRTTGVVQAEPPGGFTVNPTLVSESDSTELTVSESAGAVEIAAAIEAALTVTLSPTDSLPGKFAALAQKLQLPARSLCRWIRDKCDAKRRTGYPIDSPGALYKFAQTDLIPWATQHRRQIALDIDLDARARLQQPATVRALPATEKSSAPHTADLTMQIRELAKAKRMRR